LNGTPVTIHVTVQGDRVTWPVNLVWQLDPLPPPAQERHRVVTRWPADFADAYRADVLALDAETGEIFTPLAWLKKG
jgi:hypothetical protein